MEKSVFFTSNEIEVTGWIKRQLEIQSEGLCGNLDKVWPDIRDSKWIGGTAEGWERVPYWLDGFVPMAYLLNDQDKIARAKKYIDAIIANQCKDGWICPCSKKERSSYDTWAVLLISKTLVVYYQCSNDERIPKIVYKTMKNFYSLLKDGTCELFRWGKYRWYEGFVAIRFLLGIYNEPWIKELAEILYKQGMDYSAVEKLWERPLNKWTFDTHIVNLVMMLKSEAISCDVLGKKYKDIAEKYYQLLYKYNGTPVELFTGDECLSGISPIQGTELCSVVEQMYSYEWLYLMTGDIKWAERLEVIAFNALPATISDDMWSHQYDQQSNQISCETLPGKSIFRTNAPDSHIFGLEPEFGCCTANFGQGWPKLALSSYIRREKYVEHSIVLPVNLDCDDLSVKVKTEYPFVNSVEYRIKCKKDCEFAVRIPSFAKDICYEFSGKSLKEKDAKHVKFIENKVFVSLKSGNEYKLIISFDADVKMKKSRAGLYYVSCGSLVFSIPIKYKKVMHEYTAKGVERKFPYCDYEYVGTSKWNYGFASKEFSIERKTPGRCPFDSNNSAIKLNAEVAEVDWEFEDGYDSICAKLPKGRVAKSAKKQIKMIPYGCAKLRMTEIPVVK